MACKVQNPTSARKIVWCHPLDTYMTKDTLRDLHFVWEHGHAHTLLLLQELRVSRQEERMSTSSDAWIWMCFSWVLSMRGKVRKQTVCLLARVLNATPIDCNIKGKDLSTEILVRNNNQNLKTNSAHANIMLPIGDTAKKAQSLTFMDCTHWRGTMNVTWITELHSEQSFLIFWDKVYCSPDWPQIPEVTENGLELMSLLHLSPMY